MRGPTERGARIYVGSFRVSLSNKSVSSDGFPTWDLCKRAGKEGQIPRQGMREVVSIGFVSKIAISRLIRASCKIPEDYFRVPYLCSRQAFDFTSSLAGNSFESSI